MSNVILENEFDLGTCGSFYCVYSLLELYFSFLLSSLNFYKKKIPSYSIFEGKKERKSTIVDDSWIVQREGEEEE